MTRKKSSSLARALMNRDSNALRKGRVIFRAGGKASVKTPDGAVLRDVPGASDGTSRGSNVAVQWQQRGDPSIIPAGGSAGGGVTRVINVTIPSVDEFEYTLPDALVTSPYFSATILNHFMNGAAMPALGAFYVGLMSNIDNANSYAEITSSIVSNIKRASVTRNAINFPLATSGRSIANAVAISDFLTSGTGFASACAVEGWGIFDAPTGGNFWFGAKFGAINGVRTRQIKAGDTFNIPAGGLRAEFSPGSLTDFEARNYLNVTFSAMGFARTCYRVGLLINAAGDQPSASAFANYKQAKIPRNTTTFPITTTKIMACATTIGAGASGTDDSFLTSGDAPSLGGALPLYGVGLYEETTGPLCWVIPANNAPILGATPPRIIAGRIVIKVS